MLELAVTTTAWLSLAGPPEIPVRLTVWAGLLSGRGRLALVLRVGGSFTVGDADTAAGSLAVAAFSSNPSVVSAGGLALGGSGANRSLTLTPLPGQSGFTTITLTAADGSGNTTSNTFLVTVVAVNDAPTLDPIANPPSLGLNAGLQTVPLSGIGRGAANENQLLMFMATSGNPTLIPNPSINYSSPGTTGSLNFTPVANASGSAVITVKLMDDGGTDRGGSNSITRTFTVTVVAQPPVLSIQQVGADVVVSWPTSSGPNWKLGCSALVPGPWLQVQGSPTIVGTNYTHTLPASGEAKYFQLCDSCVLPFLPPSSEPPPITVSRVDDELVLRWSMAGGSYVLQSATDLVNPTWVNVPGVPQISGGMATMTVLAPASGNIYFRLRRP